MSAPVSIVIPNYNGRVLMQDCLPSVVRALERYEAGGELIVVDDGSTDHSLAWLKKTVPQARILPHPTNRGFQAACHTGIEAAAHERLILLNTDVEVFPDFIAPLIEALTPADVFAVGCVALQEGGDRLGENFKQPRLSCGKLKFDKHNDLTLKEFQALEATPAPTFFVTGGFMACKRSLFLDLGGFDPLFEPFYYEDADLCFRAWKRGLKVLLHPKSVVIHRHRGSILDHHKKHRVRRIQERNRLLLLWKNLTAPGPLYGEHLLPLMLRSLVKWLALDWDFYRALAGALAKLPKIRRTPGGKPPPDLSLPWKKFLH